MMLKSHVTRACVTHFSESTNERSIIKVQTSQCNSRNSCCVANRTQIRTLDGLNGHVCKMAAGSSVTWGRETSVNRNFHKICMTVFWVLIDNLSFKNVQFT